MRALFSASNMSFLAGMLLAAAVTGVAFHDLVTAGSFAWHVSQPSFTQGLAEILLLSAMSAVAVRYFRKAGLFLATLLLLFYARRQNIDYALLLAMVYASGILAIGSLMRTLMPSFRATSDDCAHPASMLCEVIVLGVLGFSLAQWLLALCGINYKTTIESSWILAALAIVVAVALKARQIANGADRRDSPSGILNWIISSSREDLFFSMAFSLLVFVALAALAKSNYAIEYDAAWYGLRPDRVLFFGGSVFSRTNLEQQIYYYPKLYELLTTPLSNSGDNSTIIAFTVICWFAFVASATALASTFSKDKKIQVAFALLAGTTPAMIAISCTGKGDLLASAMIIIGLTKTFEFAQSWQIRHAAIAASALILASLIRITELPYALLPSFFLAICILYAIYRKKVPVNPLRHPARTAWLIVLAATCVFIIVSLRTYVLTGIPIIAPSQLEDLALFLGMTRHFPIANALNWEHIPILPFFTLTGDFLFHPAPLRIAALTWPGSSWLILAVLGLAGALYPKWRVKPQPVDYLIFVALLSVGLMFFAILAKIHFHDAGGNGNYYIVPITALMAGFLLLCRKMPPALIAGISFGAAIVGTMIFMMTANWWPGTRSFDWSLNRSPFDDAQFTQTTLAKRSLTEVYSQTSGCGANIAVLGALAIPEAYMLPSRFESLRRVAPRNSNSAATFANYLRATNVDVLIVPNENASTELLKESEVSAGGLSVARNAAALLLAGSKSSGVTRTANFSYFALSDAGAKCVAATATPTAASTVASTPVPEPEPCPSGPDSKDSANAHDSGQSVASHRPMIWLEPDRMSACARNGKAVVHWDASALPGVKTVEVRTVNDQGEKVFARANPVGSKETGPWMHAGSRMLLRNVADSALLGCAAVTSVPCVEGKQPSPN